MGQITKDTALAELINNKKFIDILNKYKIPCFSCPFASFEIQYLTLEQICQTYQINLKKLIKDLNQKYDHPKRINRTPQKRGVVKNPKNN